VSLKVSLMAWDWACVARAAAHDLNGFVGGHQILRILGEPEDPAKGGTWYDDKGSRVCIWYWDAARKTVTIVREFQSKRLGLSGIADHLLTPGECLLAAKSGHSGRAELRPI